MTRLLILGKSGQVATALVPALTGLGEVICSGREVCDFARPHEVHKYVKSLAPNLIINAAAYTAVDKAESEPMLCRSINAISVGALATAACELGVPVIHYSTDYVFDGSKRNPYVESDLPAPLNIYGATKWEGEQLLAASQPLHVIFRISWIYGNRGANFLQTMLRLAREREELKIVDDQIGAPTSSVWVAMQTAQVVRQALHSGDPNSYFAARSGACHLTTGGQTTWRKFAERIFSLDPGKSEHVLKRVVPILTSDYPTAALRPLYSVMDNGVASRRFGLFQKPWEQDLEEVLEAREP